MIINGKEIAEEIIDEIEGLRQTNGQKRVVFITFGPSPETQGFLNIKSRLAERLGISSRIIRENSCTTDEARVTIDKAASSHDGVVVQLPIQENLDIASILDSIPSEVDIDMLSSEARRLYTSGSTSRVPPVANAVWRIFQRHGVDPRDRKIVLLGRGRLVGEPVSLRLTMEGIRHDVVDINTGNSEKLKLLAGADIIVSGIGVPHYIKPEMIKEGVVLIDAGASEQAGRVAGDIDPLCAEKASLFTPVPGGVGPVTVASLFLNLYRK